MNIRTQNISLNIMTRMTVMMMVVEQFALALTFVFVFKPYIETEYRCTMHSNINSDISAMHKYLLMSSYYRVRRNKYSYHRINTCVYKAPL